MTNTEIATETPTPSMLGLLQNAARNAPAIPDDTLPRYGMSFLLPIPLSNLTGNNFIGDFNPKIDNDPKRGNLVNFSFYPAFELMAFYGGQAEIPFEKNPSYSDEILSPEPFEFTGFQQNAQKGYTVLDYSARRCAETALRKFAEIGYQEFASLLNFHFNDPDKGLSACDKLVQLILPLRDLNFFADKNGNRHLRIKNGIPFRGPFLDEMELFLKTESVRRINDAKLRPETALVADKLYKEIRLGVTNAIKLANRILNETEAEIKNPNGVKKGYDEPDLEHEDAGVATDLYCLAHTDRTELDNKQLQASVNIGTALANSVRDSLADKKPVELIPPTLPKNVLTNEEVRLMMEQQQDEFDKRMAEMEAKFLAAITPQIEEPEFQEPEAKQPKNKK